MPSVDPTDTGGLFIGRRPGTRPPKYRALPARGSSRREKIDAVLAAALMLLMTVICVSFWGPIPAGWLWVGGHVQYWTNSVSFAILAAFAGMLGTLMLALVVLKQLDAVWILVRRAGGFDQRQGVLGRIFIVSCGIGVAIFTGWLLLFSGARLTGGGIGG